MEVRGPGNLTVRFPDGTPPATIDRVMREAMAAASSKTPMLETARRAAVSGLGGMIEGVPIVGPAIKGGAEKAAAYIRSKINDTDYDNELSSVQGDYVTSATEFPKVNTGGKIAGAVGSMVPLGMTAAGAKALGVTGKNIGSRLMAGTASGAAIGGGDAAVRSEGDLDAITQGATIGAGAGLAGPVIGSAVGGGVRALRSGLQRSASQADSVAMRAMEGDQITPEVAKQQLAAMGKDAMLSDLGPNLSQHAGTIVTMPGQGQKIVRDAMRARSKNAGNRVKDALASSIGSKRNIPALADEISAQQKAAASPIYKAIGPKMVNSTKDIDSILDTPHGKIAWNKAQKLAASARNPISRDALTVDALDGTKKILDDMYNVAKKDARGNEAGILDNLRKDLIKAVDDVEPEYAVARAAFAGPAAVKDALEEGQSVFLRSTSVDDLRQSLAIKNDSEKKAFIIGARGQIEEIMGTARNDAAAAQSLFKKGWNAEKLQLIIGRERADDLLSKLDVEGRFQGAEQQATQNSLTAARQAGQRALGDGAGGDVMGVRGGYVSGGMLGTLRAIGVKGGEAGIEALRGRSKAKVREELAKMLTVTGPERDALLDRLSTAVVFSKKGEAAKAAAQAATMGSGPAYQQAP